MRSVPLARPRRQCQAARGLRRDFLHDYLPADQLANYLTVIYHRDIGFPFPAAYRHVTRFSGTGKGVVLLADNPSSDDGERVS